MAIVLAHTSFKDKDFKGHNEISVLATIDPVRILRDDYGGVPSNVKNFWNRYETKTIRADGDDGSVAALGAIPVHGYLVNSQAQASTQVDLNLDGHHKTVLYPVPGMPIDHFNIIWEVEDDLLTLLEQQHVESLWQADQNPHKNHGLPADCMLMQRLWPAYDLPLGGCPYRATTGRRTDDST